MKPGREAGHSGLVSDGMRWMTELCNAMVKNGKIPEDWSKSGW